MSSSNSNSESKGASTTSSRSPLSLPPSTLPKPIGIDQDKPEQSSMAQKLLEINSTYDALSRFSVIVCDTGDIEAIRTYRPTDATTNPSLILKAIQSKDPNQTVKEMIDDAIDYARKQNQTPSSTSTSTSTSTPSSTVTSPSLFDVDLAIDRLFVNFGTEITQLIPGVVSTELDARLSFNTEACIKRAKRLMELYREKGVDKDRVLVKIAGTWEGLQAVSALEKEGIHCNVTLLFALPQAIVADDSHATLVSPFVGRIYDWYCKHFPERVHEYVGKNDPGVQSVREIYYYLKSCGSSTQIMGASFRSVEQILALAGCDKLTISPELMEKLVNSQLPVRRELEFVRQPDPSKRVTLSEQQFREQLNENEAAKELLEKGIHQFAAAASTLEEILKKRDLDRRTSEERSS